MFDCTVFDWWVVASTCTVQIALRKHRMTDFFFYPIMWDHIFHSRIIIDFPLVDNNRIYKMWHIYRKDSISGFKELTSWNVNNNFKREFCRQIACRLCIVCLLCSDCLVLMLNFLKTRAKMENICFISCRLKTKERNLTFSRFLNHCIQKDDEKKYLQSKLLEIA